MSSAGKNSGPDYPTVTVAAGDKGSLSADHVSAQHAPLLHYRPWRGEFGGAERSIWPIARISLRMMFRRKLFWGLYGLGLLIFSMFFFGQYLLAWAETQLAEQTIKVGPVPFEPGKPDRITFALPDIAHTFRAGHRIMVQIQSSWFPLTDRNPQKFMEIPKALSTDFVKATERVYLGGPDGSTITFRIE